MNTENVCESSIFLLIKKKNSPNFVKLCWILFGSCFRTLAIILVSDFCSSDSQWYKLRVSVYDLLPPTTPNNWFNNNNSNVPYSSQREVKAVVRSYTLTHSEKMNCTYLSNSVMKHI